MKDTERELVEKIHREAFENSPGHPKAPAETTTIHYSELPEALPDNPLYQEWNTYRRKVGRWLAEGYEGKFVVIKGETIIGFYDTWDIARKAGLQRFHLTPFLTCKIQTRERPLHLRGYNLPCPS